MRLTQSRIIGIITITALSLIGLMIIQWYWLNQGALLHREQFENKMETVQRDLDRSFTRYSKTISEFSRDINGEIELFASAERARTIERLIQNVTDSIFQKNDIPLNYVLKGKATDGRCLFYVHERQRYYDEGFANAKYRLCLCHHNHQGGTVDYYVKLGKNKTAYLAKQFAGLLFPAILFLLLLVGTFSYTIITLARQKKLSAIKNDFINNLTHELKTPIFTIGLSSKMLGKSQEVLKSKKLKSYVDLIANENQRLRNQVDKVLQIALIDSGNLNLEKQKVDIHKLIRKVAQSFRVAIEEKQGKLTLALDATTTILSVDEIHLLNTIYNLVDNAYKYSNSQPTISIHTWNESPFMVIEIKDKGIGIDPKSQQLIFDRFYRAQPTDTHNVKGFGLGLSYVKSIVDLHNGKIDLESELGKGTCFRLYLPV